MSKDAQIAEWEDGTKFDAQLYHKFVLFGLSDEEQDFAMEPPLALAFAHLFDTKAVERYVITLVVMINSTR